MLDIIKQVTISLHMPINTLPPLKQRLKKNQLLRGKPEVLPGSNFSRTRSRSGIVFFLEETLAGAPMLLHKNMTANWHFP
jgi:hypothetical protein